MTAPFFVFYDARSGSTFLSRLLVDQLSVFIPPESRFLPRLLQMNFGTNRRINAMRFGLLLLQDSKLRDWNIEWRKYLPHLWQTTVDIQKTADVRRLFLDDFLQYYMHANGIHSPDDLSQFGFKKGYYQWFVDEIWTLYPDARFICLIRDGRAVFNSKRKSPYSETGRPFETDPVQAAEHWVRCMANFRHILTTYPDTSTSVRYEDIIAHPAEIVRKLGQFLAVELSKSEPCEELSYIVPQRYSAIHSNVYRAPLKDRVDAWKDELSQEEVEVFQSIADKQLRAYGYELL